MAALVVLVVAAFLILPKLNPAEEVMASPEPTEDLSYLTLQDLTVDDVDKVTLENDGVTTVLVYDETSETYKIQGAEEREIDQTAARNVFYTAAYIQAESLVDSETDDLAQFGFADPVSKVTADYKDGTSSVFLYGNTVPGSGQYYMMMQDDDSIYVVWNNYGNNAKLKLNDLLSVESQSFEMDALSVIRLHKNGEVHMEFTNVADSDVIIDMGTWKLTQPYKRSLSSSSEVDPFYTMVEDILNLKPDSILDSEGTPEEYGLDEPWAVIDLVPFEGEELSLIIAEGEDGKSAMMYSDSDIIYEINTARLDFMDYEPIDLIERLLSLINVKYVDEMQMTGVAGNNTLVVTNTERVDEDGNAKLDGNGNPITDTNYIVDGVELTEDEQEQGSWFYQTILSVKVTREADDDFVPGAPVGSIKWKLNVDTGEYIVQFYEYDEYFYAVKFNDDETYLIVNKKDITAIADNFELLRERKMERPY
jgi:hypothetical protein